MDKRELRIRFVDLKSAGSVLAFIIPSLDKMNRVLAPKDRNALFSDDLLSNSDTNFGYEQCNNCLYELFAHSGIAMTI